MYRIDDNLDPLDLRFADELETLAKAAGVHVSWARGRCSAGYTREEYCVDCDGGYTTDGAIYANLRGQPWIALVTDDFEDVAYVQKRDQNKLLRIWSAQRMTQEAARG